MELQRRIVNLAGKLVWRQFLCKQSMIGKNTEGGRNVTT